MRKFMQKEYYPPEIGYIPNLKVSRIFRITKSLKKIRLFLII